MNKALVNSDFFRETADPEAAARLDRSDVMSRWILAQDECTQRQEQARAREQLLMAFVNGLSRKITCPSRSKPRLEIGKMPCAALPLQALVLPCPASLLDHSFAGTSVQLAPARYRSKPSTCQALQWWISSPCQGAHCTDIFVCQTG